MMPTGTALARCAAVAPEVRRSRKPATPGVRSYVRTLLLATLLGATTGALSQQLPDPSYYATIVSAADRTDADRQTDRRRDPVALLAFTGARPGMRVLDMGAGAGYSTELMARAVSPGGVVYAQDSRASERFDTRAAKPVMKNVVRLVRPYDDPFPADLPRLDMITFFFAYHDTVNAPIDRVAMNRQLFAALKPGGILVIADHSARSGVGLHDTKTLHRIEEAQLRQEVEAAGFKQVAEGDFLHHPEDPRDVAIFRAKTPVDEFVLKFEKPR
jgi:predicted methyltransferase